MNYRGQKKAWTRCAFRESLNPHLISNKQGKLQMISNIRIHNTGRMFVAVFRIHDILEWIRIRGSMPLTNGSGSCFFRHWPSRCQPKNYFCSNIFSAYYCLKVHLHNFPKKKSQKESQNSRNQGFSYYFCMMTEGSGSKPLTNGSGSGRPKNRWIRIRIHNTGSMFVVFTVPVSCWLMPHQKGRKLLRLLTPLLWLLLA